MLSNLANVETILSPLYTVVKIHESDIQLLYVEFFIQLESVWCNKKVVSIQCDYYLHSIF